MGNTTVEVVVVAVVKAKTTRRIFVSQPQTSTLRARMPALTKLPLHLPLAGHLRTTVRLLRARRRRVRMLPRTIVQWHTTRRSPSSIHYRRGATALAPSSTVVVVVDVVEADATVGRRSGSATLLRSAKRVALASWVPGRTLAVGEATAGVVAVVDGVAQPLVLASVPRWSGRR